MAIQFTCTSCGKKMQAPDGAAGKQAICPSCATMVTVPKPAGGAPAGGTPAGTAPPAGGQGTPAAKPETIDFKCVSCQTSIRTPASAAGKQAKCPKCGAVVVVPTKSQAKSASPPPLGPAPTPPQPTPPQPTPPAPTPPAQKPSSVFDEMGASSTSSSGGDLFAGVPSTPPAAPRTPAPAPSYRPPPANPYAAPAQPAQRSVRDIDSMLRTPAMILSVLAGIHLVLNIIGGVLQTILLVSANGDPVEIISRIVGSVIGICVHGVIISGCSSMMQRRNIGMAWAAMILGVIPCFCSPCLILGIPFGIWGMVVLSKPEVSSSFR